MAEFNYGKPCTRCLLEEAGNRDMARLISERISVIPEDKKADGELYKMRLDLCKGCDSLNGGTCVKCGCYVELRAARKDGYCPSENRLW